ncbi:MAG: hypothetical protein WEB06_10795 [Actinomycetota bacterium]
MRMAAMRGRWAVVLSAFAAPVLLLAACGGGEEAGGARTTVDVRLQEWAVLPAQASSPAGQITFRAENTGPEDEHELVVIRTDLAPDALPVRDDGSVDEEGAGIQIVGEIEEFAVGQTESQTFDLSEGKYVLICNLMHTEHGATEAHYRMGMRAAFTVT